ncbi:uncharacterized protein [Aristolochia californica]|uniref:uncharacterized protein n=1 Tax=Aristolochia californica TaxID=171875 RepID=UPI0035DDD731
MSIIPDVSGKSPAAHQFAKRWKEKQEMARVFLHRAARKMKKYADLKRRAVEFKVGDLVLVKMRTEQFRSLRTKNKGLIKRYEGPFPITKRIGKLAYQLQLPTRLRIHNVFHVSNLKPYNKDLDPGRVIPPRPPIDVITTFERHVDYIIADRQLCQRGKPWLTEYLVKWRGLPESEATWHEAAEL